MHLKKGVQSRGMLAPGILRSFGATGQMSRENKTLKKKQPQIQHLLLEPKIACKSSYLFQIIFVWYPSLSHGFIHRYFQVRITQFQRHQILFDITYLLLCLGNFQPYPIGLTSFIAWRTWQAVETWICVDTAMDLIHLKANI